MADPAIALEALPAAYGDCLLVRCPVPGGEWRLLVDCGPDEAWPALRDRLSALPAGPDGRRHLDLVVVSHIDHDHIGAARLLFADASLGLSFGDVWFNARRHLERGVAEGEALAALLGAPGAPLPWNAAFGGGPVAAPADGGFVELPAAEGRPRVTVLGPPPKRLDRLAAVWDAELARLRRRESNTEEDSERGSDFPDLVALAAHPSRRDRSVPNGSSIALLVEHRGAAVLLAADAFPNDLGLACLGLARHRGTAPPLAVDVLKLSHHGSRANLMAELFGAVRAEHYVVSTDNARFGHPNDEALARVVRYGGAAPVIWFNYGTERNRRWADPALQREHGFTTRYPDTPAGGIVVEIPAR